MKSITTSELKTKSTELLNTLKKGASVHLVHKSQIVGVIKPQKEEEPKVMTKEGIETIKKLAKELNLPKMTYKQREKKYRDHLMEKYGKGIS